MITQENILSFRNRLDALRGYLWLWRKKNCFKRRRK